MLFFHQVRQEAFREATQNAGKPLALVHAPAKSAPLRAQKELQFAQNFSTSRWSCARCLIEREAMDFGFCG